VPSADPVSDAAFQCAFAAMSYFAGVRDAERLAPFASRSAELGRLAAELASSDRQARAQALSRELGVLARSIEARRLA